MSNQYYIVHKIERTRLHEDSMDLDEAIKVLDQENFRSHKKVWFLQHAYPTHIEEVSKHEH